MKRVVVSAVAVAVLVVTPTVSSAQEEAPLDVSASLLARSDHQCRGSKGYPEDFEGRRTFLWRPQWLEAIAADEDRHADIIAKANQALQRGPYSVTHKSKLVPGASANDYASIGPYWWPDPKRSDGLPYTRRDGEVNPERNGADFDKDRVRKLGSDMEALALGYYLTDDRRYAEHAALLVTTWFLDPQTRMSPNMNFAQGIPGRVEGRGEGIIEASDLSTVVESIGLIAPSGVLSEDQQAGLRNWFAQFATWLATSENGTHEMQKTNNHSVFFDFYLAHFALFAGLDSVTKNVVSDFPDYRLARQMDRQGRFIAELRRTRSWHYSNYILAGAGRLATIGECVDEDLWSTRLDDGRGLTTAMAFLDEYSSQVEAWRFPDRDHAAGRFERMERTHHLVETLFARGDSFGSEGQLP